MMVTVDETKLVCFHLQHAYQAEKDRFYNSRRFLGKSEWEDFFIFNNKIVLNLTKKEYDRTSRIKMGHLLPNSCFTSFLPS